MFGNSLTGTSRMCTIPQTLSLFLSRRGWRTRLIKGNFSNFMLLSAQPTCCTYKSLGCLDLEIWRFSCQRRQTKPIALPLAHARGVINATSHLTILNYSSVEHITHTLHLHNNYVPYLLEYKPGLLFPSGLWRPGVDRCRSDIGPPVIWAP